ncbi:hypothetical protein T265_02990 [Opisthorchis viverrini]|uniref:Strabismus protein n=1 Tax=Opisthorchis viverrini TaxID=6198 RepID=A0A074ZU67_OPIVI|nr:hypothetical protein T265_02990 [Opisthorchis viverrini]KER30641.1 hypothetical protein T265_02990 [Opisthorchis viverrini]
MDVESLRSGRSEKSDRSRKSKRVQMINHGTLGGHQLMSDEQFKLTQRNQIPLSNQGQPVGTPMDSALRSYTPNVLAPSAQQPCLQPRQQTPYTMYNWAPPPPCPSYPNYPQPTPYTTMGWPNQMMPTGYPQQLSSPPFNGTTLPVSLQQQGPQPMQQVQTMQQPTNFIPINQQPTVLPSLTNHGSTAQSGTGNTQSQRSESYRAEQFESHLGNQDDTAWVEDATAVTGATSETGLSGGDNMSRFGARFGLAASLGLQQGGGGGYGVSGAAAALIRTEADDINVLTCSRVLGVLASSCVALGALLSPVLMLLLPYFPFAIGWGTESCRPTCEGHLVGISVKLALLSLATWVISSPCRPLCAGGSAILPRVRLCRTLFLCLVFVVLFAFWLFYTVRILQPREKEFLSIVLFADSLTDTLLFLHYAGIGLMELRKGRHRYAVHIVRSPDGMSKTMKCGEMSLQRAAIEVLQFYMVEFTAYTPGQSNGGNAGGGKRGRRGGASNDSGPGTNGGGGSKYKFYDVDGGGLEKSAPGYTIGGGHSNTNNTGNTPSASARLFEELELEKRTRKRRMRLLLAVEEAFTHVRRLATENYAASNPGQATVPLLPQSNGLAFKGKQTAEKSLDPYEAAQAVFPTLIRPLQKYMRVTRQQARHPVDMVIDHLALCLAYGLSPQAFLERFNPLAATPQMDAAAAATSIMTAKRDRKQRLTNQQQLQQQTPTAGGVADTGPLLPKRVHPGGQQSWSIVADRALSRSLADGAIFQLRRGNDISLLCTVRRLPLIRLIEEVLEPLEVGRFTLNTNNAV